jgi:hypothetical protein
VSMYAMEWLTTFFVYNFPLTTSRRVWDIMLARGYVGGLGSLSWLYQICMAIIESCYGGSFSPRFHTFDDSFRVDQLLKWDLDEIMTSIRTLTTKIPPNILLQRAVDFDPTDTLRARLHQLAGQKEAEKPKSALSQENCLIS